MSFWFGVANDINGAQFRLIVCGFGTTRLSSIDYLQFTYSIGLHVDRMKTCVEYYNRRKKMIGTEVTADLKCSVRSMYRYGMHLKFAIICAMYSEESLGFCLCYDTSDSNAYA